MRLNFNQNGRIPAKTVQEKSQAFNPGGYL
jgi:hypothetical protein